jgi:LDH2 family malate/lactate/ureidoglycolate dehydrogenase
MKKFRIPYQEIKEYLTEVFEIGGMPQEMAVSNAKILLEGELLGHRTHGLDLLKPYLNDLNAKLLNTSLDIETINSTLSSELWNGDYKSGTWLTEKALGRASEIANSQGIGTVVIQKSHHIACLAAYLEEYTKQNLMVLIACSDPRNKTVAPFGGKMPVYSPNPLAIGIPTETIPILMDVSMSTTANGVVAKAAKNNRLLPGDWLLNNQGMATNDPKSFYEEPPATLLPLGGLDLGYKGFALGIMIEAMTNALGGHGRSDNPDRWGATVFVQVINPKLFSGESYFLSEMEYFRNQCINNQNIDDNNPVRMPGERGLQLKQNQLELGIELSYELVEDLYEIGKKYKVRNNIK